MREVMKLWQHLFNISRLPSLLKILACIVLYYNNESSSILFCKYDSSGHIFLILYTFFPAW